MSKLLARGKIAAQGHFLPSRRTAADSRSACENCGARKRLRNMSRVPSRPLLQRKCTWFPWSVARSEIRLVRMREVCILIVVE